jgi:hypothetical protein
MRHHQLALLFSLLLLAVASCRPNVGAPISLIGGPAILAVKGQPAEVIPGAMVSYEVLAVDSGGAFPRPRLAGTLRRPRNGQYANCRRRP